MKETNISTIEKALSMYKETVSPQEQTLNMILSQIPEINKEKRRVIRSPYMWFAITQAVALCSVILMVYPAFVGPAYQNDPFYAIDQKIDDFDAKINQEDYEKSLLDYSQE